MKKKIILLLALAMLGAGVMPTLSAMENDEEFGEKDDQILTKEETPDLVERKDELDVGYEIESDGEREDAPERIDFEEFGENEMLQVLPGQDQFELKPNEMRMYVERPPEIVGEDMRLVRGGRGGRRGGFGGGRDRGRGGRRKHKRRRVKKEFDPFAAVGGPTYFHRPPVDPIRPSSIPGGQNYFYVNMGAKAATGLINGFRLNAYTSTDANKIKKYALASMIANGVSFGCNALSQYQMSKLDLTCASDVAEAAMALRMYRNAENIAKINAEMTPEEMGKVKMSILAVQGCLVVNRVSGITMDHKKARFLKGFYNEKEERYKDDSKDDKKSEESEAYKEAAEKLATEIREERDGNFANRFYSAAPRGDAEDYVDDNFKVKRIYSYLLSASPALGELIIYQMFYNK
jgi:hypothetical protein